MAILMPFRFDPNGIKIVVTSCCGLMKTDTLIRVLS
jgi:hypothetical protein